MKKASLLVISAIFLLLAITSINAQDNQSTSTTENTGLTVTTDGVTTTESASDETTGAEPQQSSGSAYVCTLNNVQRRVEIDLLNAPAPVPCEVNYYKDTEAPGSKSTLWSANNDSNYCESQAKAFIEKLEGLNWSCQGK